MSLDEQDPKSKPKEKAPAFQFYPKDFLTDDKVLAMNAELRGLYITLLCVDWLNDGFYSKAILKLSGFEWLAYDGTLRGDSQDIEDQLLDCFIEHPDKPGYLTNPRLLKERESQKERREERIRAGEKGAAKRWKNPIDEPSKKDSTAIELPIAKHASSSSSSSSSSNYISIDTPIFPPKLDNQDCARALEHWKRHYKKVKKSDFDAIQAEALFMSYADRPEAFIWDILKSVENEWHNIRDCSHLKAQTKTNGYQKPDVSATVPLSQSKVRGAEIYKPPPAIPRVPTDPETQAKLNALTGNVKGIT